MDILYVLFIYIYIYIYIHTQEIISLLYHAFYCCFLWPSNLLIEAKSRERTWQKSYFKLNLCTSVQWEASFGAPVHFTVTLPRQGWRANSLHFSCVNIPSRVEDFSIKSEAGNSSPHLCHPLVIKCHHGWQWDRGDVIPRLRWHVKCLLRSLH